MVGMAMLAATIKDRNSKMILIIPQSYSKQCRNNELYNFGRNITESM